MVQLLTSSHHTSSEGALGEDLAWEEVDGTWTGTWEDLYVATERMWATELVWEGLCAWNSLLVVEVEETLGEAFTATPLEEL